MMEFDIYDAASPDKGDYWQMRHVAGSPKGGMWQAVADAVNQGLPSRETELFRCTDPVRDQALWGCIRWAGCFWWYRIFLAGRDGFNRPGRYFFVVFRTDSATGAREFEMTRVERGLELQVGIPLDVKHLPASQDPHGGGVTQGGHEIAADLVRGVGGMQEGEHRAWIVKGGRIERSHPLLPAPTSPRSRDGGAQRTVPAREDSTRARPLASGDGPEGGDAMGRCGSAPVDSSSDRTGLLPSMSRSEVGAGKRRWIFGAFLAVALICASVMAMLGQRKTDQQCADMRQQLDSMNRRFQEDSENFNTLSKDIDAVKIRLEGMQSKVDQIQSKPVDQERRRGLEEVWRSRSVAPLGRPNGVRESSEIGY